AVYAIGGDRQTVFQVARVQKSVSAAAKKGQAGTGGRMDAPALVATDNGDLLVLDAKRKLWRYSGTRNSLQMMGLKGSGQWKQAQALVPYGPNVYVLDPAAGNIYRYVPGPGGQYTNAPTLFFPRSDRALLGKAVGMAIDGSIWVSTSDGQILKLAGAQRQPFTVTGLPRPLTKLGGIVTSVNTRSVYVLDAASNRIVQIGKDGAYQRQLALGVHSPVTSFWVDELSHQLYVLAANKLYLFQIPV
ncbi:MAG: NHL repeat-containing protein, partial [Chloroflexota bacterium]